MIRDIRGCIAWWHFVAGAGKTVLCVKLLRLLTATTHCNTVCVYATKTNHMAREAHAIASKVFPANHLLLLSVMKNGVGFSDAGLAFMEKAALDTDNAEMAMVSALHNVVDILWWSYSSATSEAYRSALRIMI